MLHYCNEGVWPAAYNSVVPFGVEEVWPVFRYCNKGVWLMSGYTVVVLSRQYIERLRYNLGAELGRGWG